MTDRRYPQHPEDPQGYGRYSGSAQGYPYQQPAGYVPQGAPQPYGAGSGPTKNHAVAIILSLFFGTLGIDRFYLGHIGLGIAKLLLSWLTFGVWQLIDLLLIILRGTNALKRINWQ